MNVGIKIRQIRELKGLSQENMAELLHVSQAAYSKLEKNDNIGMDKIKAIAQIFKIDPIQLLSFDENHIFNNNNQQGGNAASILIQYISNKERDLYEQRINHLEEEVKFLREKI